MAEWVKSPEIKLDQVGRLLEDWIAGRAAAAAGTWLSERIAQVKSGDQKALFLAFGLAPRKVGKADLDLSEADLQAAEAARPGWQPQAWSVDQAARTRLVLAIPTTAETPLIETLDKLFAAGEVGELVSLYQALPLLPDPQAHVARAAEGLRTNIKSVFCAVAQHNPYPAEQLDEGQWNQMVLKSLFIGAELWPIVGLDARANPRLMRMLADYAHERWAAGRSVSPELWRCVGPFADQEALTDLKRVLDTGTAPEQTAAALALSSCPDPKAKELLQSRPDLAQGIQRGELSWNHLCKVIEDRR